MALDLTDTRYLWDTSNLPTGSNYLIRVIASDGINTGTDDSDSTFTILAGWTHATTDFDPAVLNLRSTGRYATVYIELPLGYNVSQIDITSIRLNGKVPALAKPTKISDYDRDGIPDLMVKFDRRPVIALFAGKTVPGNYPIEVTGTVAETKFKGTTVIRVISP